MKYLSDEERERIRTWIFDEKAATDIRLWCDAEGWVAEVGGVLIEGDSPADILEKIANCTRES